MNKLIVLLPLALLAVLFVGYYETNWAEDNKMVFFIKKTPTLQVRFVNFFATDSEDRNKLYKLNNEERQLIVDYCKYHLGIEIGMKTQEEMDRCESGYYATFKNLPGP